MVEASVDLLGLLRKQAADADLDFLREAVAVQSRWRDPQACRDPADRLRSQPRQLHGPLAELLWAGSGHP